MKECCKNCVHLRELWWWKNYPNDMQKGWCCNLFDTKKDDYTLIQLYSIDGETELCECFQKKE